MGATGGKYTCPASVGDVLQLYDQDSYFYEGTEYGDQLESFGKYIGHADYYYRISGGNPEELRQVQECFSFPVVLCKPPSDARCNPPNWRRLKFAQSQGDEGEVITGLDLYTATAVNPCNVIETNAVEFLCRPDDETDHSKLIAILFGSIGGLVFVLYLIMMLCPPRRALDKSTMWGYRGRKGFVGKIMWSVMTLITIAAVLGVVSWLVYISSNYPGSLELLTIIVFLAGVLLWPVGILTGMLRLAQFGSLTTAVGSILLLVVIVKASAPPLVFASAILIVFHCCLIDGLWAVLSPPASSTLTVELMQ